MKKLTIGIILFLLLVAGAGYFFSGDDGDPLVRKLIEQGKTTDTLVTYDQNGQPQCDGLGVTHVPFGQIISTCGRSWYVTFWGTVITLKDDGGISGHISEAIAQDFQPVLLDRQVTNLPSDYYQAQAGSVYQFGDLFFVFVLQKNVNTPLLDLPADVQTKQSGVLVSGDKGAHWQSFLVYENPVMAGGLAFHVNPIGMFVKENRFFIDVEDGAGAGSGEGQLTRFVLSDDQTSWEIEGCYYYIQEVYDQVDGLWLLDPSDDCLSLTFTE